MTDIECPLPTGQPGSAEYYSVVTTVIDGTPYDVCTKDADFFGEDPPLSEGVGWGLVLGFGIAFALLTSYLLWLEQRYSGVNISSEFFNTAGRNVGTGLTACVIVSQWTWAATLLQSSNVAYQYGVSGPFWYASGATIQIFLFGIIAIELKRKAPNSHTMPEIVMARWGMLAHKVFIYFGFCTNVIVSAMLVLGGAATINALTGMDIYAASFFIPVMVIPYTMAGGLKATFVASYLHTAFIFAILIIFVYGVYVFFDDLGKPSKVYDELKAVASSDRCCGYYCSNTYDADTVAEMGVNCFKTLDGLINSLDEFTTCEYALSVNADQSCGPVADNRGGEYLTMLSEGGLIFGVINIVGNFGTVFVDQSYWQSAIAAKPSSSYKGYLLGGLIWFTIPFALATSLGLSCVALDLPVTGDEAGQGLVPPAAATHFLGSGGSVAIAIMLFMAITSTGSAEQIAVSSIVAYDIYRTYINPNATGADILKVSRIAIVGFGLFMGVISIVLYEIGLGLGWVYLFMGVVIGSAVIPVFLLLTWSKASAMGAVVAALSGQILALGAWLTICGAYLDEINIDNLGDNYVMLGGNLVAIIIPGLVHIGWSIAMPQNFDFSTLNDKISLIDDKLPELDPEENDPAILEGAKSWIVKWGGGFTILMVIIWPVLSLPAGVFSEGYWTMWVIIAIVWGSLGTICVIFLPLYESMESIKLVLIGLFCNDDVHLRMDVLEKKLDGISEKVGAPIPDDSLTLIGRSMEDGYRARILALGHGAPFIASPTPAPGEGDTPPAKEVEKETEGTPAPAPEEGEGDN